MSAEKVGLETRQLPDSQTMQQSPAAAGLELKLRGGFDASLLQKGAGRGGERESPADACFGRRWTVMYAWFFFHIGG